MDPLRIAIGDIRRYGFRKLAGKSAAFGNGFMGRSSTIVHSSVCYTSSSPMFLYTFVTLEGIGLGGPSKYKCVDGPASGGTFTTAPVVC